MAAITVNKITDPVFGNLVQLTNGLLDIRVSMDFGPRVMHLSRVGMENMFYQDKTKSVIGDKYDVFDDQLIIYGGHRVWLSPEVVPRCYHPDNEPVTMEEVSGGAKFTAAPEKHNGIQKGFTIVLEEGAPYANVLHTITNVGLWDIEIAIWCLSMMDGGGQEVMPMPDTKSGYLPNRNISLWEYSEMNDSRVYWGKGFITLTPNADMTHPFKLGYNNADGWAAYFNKGQAYVKRFELIEEGMYPDGGCSYESYVNAKMLEMETLGELTILEPGESVSLQEEWELYQFDHEPTNDEGKLKSIIEELAYK